MSKIVCLLDRIVADKGLSMARLSRDTGLHPATLRALRDNTFSRLDNATVIRLCDYFSISTIDELFALTED